MYNSGYNIKKCHGHIRLVDGEIVNDSEKDHNLQQISKQEKQGKYNIIFFFYKKAYREIGYDI